jgi:branched-chain amino acid transport system substrate-binding protein
MLRLRTLLTLSLAPAACALAVAACGGAQQAATIPTATTSATAPGHETKLFVYSGLPLNGPQRTDALQIEQGIRFALGTAHYRAHSYSIRYVARSDSASSRSRTRRKRAVTPSRGWNQVATANAAEAAARNPRTVAYIGDLDSGATELSLPILNQAGIVQITPGSGYPGLTDAVHGVTAAAYPAEPGRYYPHGRGSLLRLIPNDVVQAAAAIDWLKHDESSTCRTVATAQFGNDPESVAMARAIAMTAKLYKLGFYAMEPPSNDTKTYEADGATLVAHGVNCFVLAGRATPAAIAFTTEIENKLPVGSVIIGTSSLCNADWTDPARGGVSARVDASLYCTTPVRRLASYPDGKHFSALFHRTYHKAPTAYTFWGYLAGMLVLKAIDGIDLPDTRAAVMSNLVNNVNNPPAYTFDSDGDLSPGPAGSYYGLDKIVKGMPRPYQVLKPGPLLPES